jgi:hypothetical protein
MVHHHVIYAITLPDSDDMIGYICFYVSGEECDLGDVVTSKYRGKASPPPPQALQWKR